MVFIAPKLFGGKESRTPVAGIGVEMPAEAALLELRDIQRLGEDLLLEYETAGKIEDQK